MLHSYPSSQKKERKRKGFRPISLVGSIYKIISKTLTGRVREVLTSVIYLNQSAFIGGKQSVDSVLVANECIDEMIK